MARTSLSYKPNWGRQEISRKDNRQEVGSGVLGAQVEMPNAYCFFSLSLFFKALLLAVFLKPCF
jgi:hypothetical protein